MVSVLSVKTQGAKSLGSATDANVTSEENAQRILQAPVLTLGMFQVGYFNQSYHRVFRESRTSRLSGGLELRLLSRPQMS